jgi:enoyl-CoA hydratase
MNYDVTNNIATLTFDDGKANAVGPGFLEQINNGLDRAEQDNVGAVILRGREGIFSGGFDLGEFKKGPAEGMAMVSGGFKLLIRLYSFPRPLIAACTGHGIALGAFIIMACDTRIGTAGKFKFSLPETAISMDLPPILMALTQASISAQHLTRVAIQSRPYAPEAAVEAGFIDEVVEAGDLAARCQEIAEELAQLPQQFYARNKLAARQTTLDIMQGNYDEMQQAQAERGASA